MSGPAVTVITATYNRSAFLHLTLQSLLRQDLPDFEAWVVGDACTDDSEQVVGSFDDPRLRWHNLERNTGHQSGPNNEGLRRAKGRYVAYLGHDDLWLPWHLSTAVACLESQDADWVHTFCAMIGPQGAAWGIGAPPAGATYETHSVPPSCWLLRRDVIAEIGAWRHYTELAHPVDADVLKRIWKAGDRMTFCPQLTVLKFPSWEYPGIYQHRGEPPHAPYLTRLVADAGQLQRDLYREIALSLARMHATVDEPPAVVAQRLWQVVMRRVKRACGEDRWPLSAYGRWDYQRRFRQGRRKRGLT